LTLFNLCGVLVGQLAGGADGEVNAVMFFDFDSRLGKGMIRPEIGDGALQGPGIGATSDGSGLSKGAKQLAGAPPPVSLL
jgi:hypothetical protein